MNNENDYQFYEHGIGGPVLLYLSAPEETGGGKALFEELSAAAEGEFLLVVLPVRSWDRFLTPWPAEGGMGKRSFTGEGRALLSRILSEILPALSEQYPQHKEIYLAGYSLAGLFALWALYESEAFAGAASASGSLWYPGWTAYGTGEKWRNGRAARVYLSLGDREHRSRNPFMRKVQEATEMQYRYFCEQENVTAVFRQEQGGHFEAVRERTLRACLWLLKGK